MATIKLIESEEEFAQLKPEWDELVAGNPSFRVFQTFDWVWSVWVHWHKKLRPSDRLFIIHATRDRHPEKALFPFCLTSDGTLEFISSAYSDLSDAIYKSHTDNWDSFYCDVAKYIQEDSRVKSLSLTKLNEGSELLNFFSVCFPRACVQRQYPYSYLEVGRGEELSASLGHLNSKERSYVRSLLKKGSELQFEIYAKAMGMPFPRTEILELRDHMVSTGARQLVAVPNESVDCMEAAYEKGLCEVAVLKDERGVFHLASYRLLLGRHVNFWMVLYREGSLTTVADAKYMAAKIVDGDYLFDWGIGVYAYKLGTFRPRVGNVYHLTVHPKRFKWFLTDFKEAAKTVARRYLRG